MDFRKKASKRLSFVLKRITRNLPVVNKKCVCQIERLQIKETLQKIKIYFFVFLRVLRNLALG
jgi:hypothetical protein